MTSAAKLKVFISYSRKDALSFIQQLKAAVEAFGHEVLLDVEDIVGGEKWEERLLALILEADTVIFVLTPESVVSEYCEWEIARTLDRGKRLIPVAAYPLGEARPPGLLGERQRIHFYEETSVPGSGFGDGIRRLAADLAVDPEWVREHTRLVAIAERWRAQREADGPGAGEDALLIGRGIEQAEEWVAHRHANSPEPPAIVVELIRASRAAADSRVAAERRQLTEMQAAHAAREEALKQKEEAQAREAEAQKARSKAQRRIAWVSVAAAIMIVSGALLYARNETKNAEEQSRLKDEAEQQKSTVDELITRIRVGGSDPNGIDAMRKICGDAIAVTANLARAPSDAQNQKLFWELYWGPMNIIEIREQTEKYHGDTAAIVESRIESAMVAFGNNLKSPGRLVGLAEDVKKRCDEYLK